MDTKLKNNIKLEEISTQYSKFDKNQVLTETQLNGFLDYFDDQHRLSRTSLSGVGIVCGFKLSYAEQEVQIEGEIKNEFRLKITQGRGVTTDGDLLALQKELEVIEGRNNEILKSIELLSKTYGYYKTFTDTNANYEHFIDEEDKQIPLLELFETQNENDSLEKIQDLSGIEEMVVLLYLENYSKDGDLCTKLSCDNQGIAQVAKLKVLLVSLDNAEYILRKDSIYKQHNWYETYTNLPEVQVKRAVLTCENTKTFLKLRQNYHDAIQSDNIIEKLNEGFDSIFGRFKYNSLRIRINQLFGFTENTIPMDFQYRYDLLKDLVDTYNEIKELLLHLNVDCCPEIGSFPKHLMLGKVKETEPYATFRHQFYKSPIIGHDNENYQKVIMLIKRAKALAFGYRGFQGNSIKITPSKACSELQDKAIPFYYNVDELLLTQWSFSKTSNLKQKFNLSYHKENLSSVPPIQRPLEYSLDCFNFYRIEGHQGKIYREALKDIFEIREKRGLNFDVKALSINTSNKDIDIDEYRCQFEDLSLLLNAWKSEQSCILGEVSKFLSAFSTKEAGGNLLGIRNGHDKIKDISSATGMGAMMDASARISDMEAAIIEKEKAAVEKGEKIPYPRSRRQKTQRDLSKPNVVKEGLANEEDTIGKALINSIGENEYGSANDILAHFYDSVTEVKTNEQWKEDEELAEFVFNAVPQILVHTYLLDDKTPSTILGLDNRAIADYQMTIEELCRYVKSLQARFQKLKINEGSKQILALLINQLSTVCCSVKKLQLLHSEIVKRKDEILVQIQLSEFVKKHPGLEHKAGVRPGGTFVMVYLTENEKDEPAYERKTLEIEFTEQPIIDEKGLIGEEGFLNLWEDKISTRFVFMRNVSDDSENPFKEIVSIGKSLEETVFNFAAFLNEIWDRAGAKDVRAIAEGNRVVIGIQDRSIPENAYYIKFGDNRIIGGEPVRFFEKNTLIEANVNNRNMVVADFCLPFMFKSDCAPVNFIIPKEPVVLKLPQPYVCLKEGDEFEPMLFEKSPENLEIKAKVPEGIESGLTKNENGEDVFDARLTDESLYRKVIEFTLGDEKTDCVVTVYPDVDLSVATNVSYNNGKTIATITYLVSELMPNLIYAWDFGKGHISDQKPDQNGKITREYPLPYNEANRIEPKLNISNGFCEKEVFIEPIEFETPVDASLSIQEIYCLDKKATRKIKLPFTNINPSDGKIEIEGGSIEGLAIEGGSIEGLAIEGAFLVITPKKFSAYESEIRFTINGLSTNAKISIKPKVVIEIISGADGGFGQQGDFNWIGEALYYGYSLSVKLPENSNENELTYQWILNENPVSDKKIYSPNFLVKEESQDFNITVVVTHSNGCSSQTDMFIQIQPYPVFTLELPENKLEYCLNDENSYTITINPNIENTVVSGLGVSVNANKEYQFTPKETNLTSTGTTSLSIGGKALLTITLKDVPNASFTSKIEGAELILTNTSDAAKTYEWIIDGKKTVRKTIREEKRKIDSFEASSIRVSLTAKGDCGSSEPSVETIKLREENDTTCIDKIRASIKKDRKNLSDDIDVSQNLMKQIILPTISAYDTSVIAPNDIFEGVNNADVLQGMTRLFSQTAEQMIENRQDTFVFSELSKFYIAQIKLTFNILHCQPHTILEKDQEFVTRSMNQMRLAFNMFKEQDLVFDVENDLKDYLNRYSNDPQITAYIQQGIKDFLIPGIL